MGEVIMGGKKPLRLPRRLEPLDKPLSSLSRLMEIVDPVVEMGWTALIGINVPRCGSRRVSEGGHPP
jgi:hypothetical protein